MGNQQADISFVQNVFPWFGMAKAQGPKPTSIALGALTKRLFLDAKNQTPFFFLTKSKSKLV